MRYVIIGSAAFYGNKGAAAMLESSVQSISEHDPSAQFTLMSIYPEQDIAQNKYKNLQILPTKPLFLGAVVNLLALLYKLLMPIRPLIRKQKHIKAIYECDAYLDENGVSFIDGREVFLIYNVANILPGILMNRRVVKCSQAMGPFNNKLNNVSAKFILPKIDTILARGKQTLSHLKSLNLNNVTPAADYAFSLQVSQQEENTAKKTLKRYKLSEANNDVVGIFPSQVVRKKCEKLGRDYEQLTADFINQCNDKGTNVVLMAHAARGDSLNTHNNDLPVCSLIYEKVKDKKRTVFINEEISAQGQRYIISTFDVCLVSRFHAMIAALSVNTPVAVIGWSHKYAEVLEAFSQEDMAIDLSNLSVESMSDLLVKLQKNKVHIKKELAKNLTKVKKSSLVNTQKIIAAAQAQK